MDFIETKIDLSKENFENDFDQIIAENDQESELIKNDISKIKG